MSFRNTQTVTAKGNKPVASSKSSFVNTRTVSAPKHDNHFKHRAPLGSDPRTWSPGNKMHDRQGTNFATALNK